MITEFTIKDTMNSIAEAVNDDCSLVQNNKINMSMEHFL